MNTEKNILIIEAVNHTEIADALYKSVKNELDKARVNYEKISVSSCFEIAQALSMALDTEMYDGYITLGCIAKDESFEAKYMMAETIRSINYLAISHNCPISYGILNISKIEEAIKHANSKAIYAVNSVLKLMEIYDQMIEKCEDFEPGIIDI